MTLTELRYVVAVAERRHFGQAARACFVSQPTLSIAIKRLEDELGVVLFERARNEITLTHAGERVVEQARQVLAEAATIKEIALASQNELSGPLKLGILSSIAPYLLPLLIPILNALAPDMPILVEEHIADELGKRLRLGELDLAILSLPFTLPGLVTYPLYDEPFVALLPADHTLTNKQVLSLKEIEQTEVLLPGADKSLRDQILEFFPNGFTITRENESLMKSLEHATLETVRYMVSGGVGITLMPSTASTKHNLNNLLANRKLKENKAKRSVALASRSSFPRQKVIELFKQAVAQCQLDNVVKH